MFYSNEVCVVKPENPVDPLLLCQAGYWKQKCADSCFLIDV